MSGPKRETAILARCLRALHLHSPGAKFWRAGSGGNAFGHRCNSINVPDICGMQRDGNFLACEVKAHNGALTLEQYEFLLDVRDRGGRALVYAPLKEGGLEDFWNIQDVPQRFLPREIRGK